MSLWIVNEAADLLEVKCNPCISRTWPWCAHVLVDYISLHCLHAVWSLSARKRLSSVRVNSKLSARPGGSSLHAFSQSCMPQRIYLYSTPIPCPSFYRPALIHYLVKEHTTGHLIPVCLVYYSAPSPLHAIYPAPGLCWLQLTFLWPALHVHAIRINFESL